MRHFLGIFSIFVKLIYTPIWFYEGFLHWIFLKNFCPDVHGIELIMKSWRVLAWRAPIFLLQFLELIFQKKSVLTNPRGYRTSNYSMYLLMYCVCTRKMLGMLHFLKWLKIKVCSKNLQWTNTGKIMQCDWILQDITSEAEITVFLNKIFLTHPSEEIFKKKFF